MSYPRLVSKTVTIYQKVFLFIRFLCKYDVGYIGRTTQRLDVRMNQHIPSTISTNTLDYPAVSSNQPCNTAGRKYHYCTDFAHLKKFFNLFFLPSCFFDGHYPKSSPSYMNSSVAVFLFSEEPWLKQWVSFLELLNILIDFYIFHPF